EQVVTVNDVRPVRANELFDVTNGRRRPNRRNALVKSSKSFGGTSLSRMELYVVASLAKQMHFVFHNPDFARHGSREIGEVKNQDPHQGDPTLADCIRESGKPPKRISKPNRIKEFVPLTLIRGSA